MLVVGTPVDEHLNPDPKFVRIAVEGLLDQLRDGQHVVLRSTVYPGVTAMVEKLIAGVGAHDRRVVLPGAHRRGQGARGAALAPADRLRSHRDARCAGPRSSSAAIAPSIVHLDVEEAELAKLFANTWRYIQFAAANQLFMIANDFGLDFARIRDALKQDYPRLAGMPGPGSRGRAVPAEGHDAARGVQQQQLHARSREHDDQRGSPDLHGLEARAASTTSRR